MKDCFGLNALAMTPFVNVIFFMAHWYETVGTRYVIKNPRRQWECSFRIRNIRVDVAARIGNDWWDHLGGAYTLMEVMCALIRACIAPTTDPRCPTTYSISDLGQIVSIETVPDEYNVSLLQRSQLQWLFFFARHYCDATKD